MFHTRTCVLGQERDPKEGEKSNRDSSYPLGDHSFFEWRERFPFLKV